MPHQPRPQFVVQTHFSRESQTSGSNMRGHARYACRHFPAIQQLPSSSASRFLLQVGTTFVAALTLGYKGGTFVSGAFISGLIYKKISVKENKGLLARTCMWQRPPCAAWRTRVGRSWSFPTRICCRCPCLRRVALPRCLHLQTQQQMVPLGLP